jgi:ABC-2 type transport system permease protein
MKTSFDYYSTNFSPYQYQQLRIVEFPRYAEFAQSFPGTVPFSEAIGFVLDIDDEEDVDMAFYVTAHELAHQWFGMQVEAANVQGRLMILETLSQYAALMSLKQEYSEEKVQQFLELQEDKYLDGKRKEGGKEPSLALVENQDYIYYAKGAINMYAFQKQIGEDKVNLALKRFISDWNTIDGKLKMKTDSYATTLDLLGYFRDVTPESLQYLIGDLFEKVD